MIGGFDILLEGKTHRDDIDLILRFMRAAWPDGIVENDSGEIIKCAKANGDIFYIYKSKMAKKAWDEKGLTDEYAGSLITCTIESDCISFVIDEDGSETRKLVDDLSYSLKQNRRMFCV